MRNLITILGLTLVGIILISQAVPVHTEAGIKGVQEKQYTQLNELPSQVKEIANKDFQQPTVSAPVAVSGAKAFIYEHESGNNPGAINASSGACGLGQALPCSKMPCSLSDYACQDNFFTQYMQSRYGTWENAVAFWQSHRWW